MKSLKVVLSTLVISISLVAVCSFANKDFRKNAFSVDCFRYNQSLAFRNLDNSSPWFILSPEFKYSDNWTQYLGTPYLACEGGDLMCMFCYDTSGPISFTSILNALWTEFRISGVPYNGQNFLLYVGGSLVQVAVFTTFEE